MDFDSWWLMTRHKDFSIKLKASVALLLEMGPWKSENVLDTWIKFLATPTVQLWFRWLRVYWASFFKEVTFCFPQMEVSLKKLMVISHLQLGKGWLLTVQLKTHQWSWTPKIAFIIVFDNFLDCHCHVISYVESSHHSFFLDLQLPRNWSKRMFVSNDGP